MPSERRRTEERFPEGLEFFFVPPAHITPHEARVEGEEFSHLARVMRKHEGDSVGIVDGAGRAYLARVAQLHTTRAVCAIVSAFPGLHEPTRRLFVGLALLRNPSRFDVAVEKLTELGVRKIVPLSTERTVPHQARVERWQKVALAAMKQCGRCVLPEVTPLKPFGTFLATAPGEKVILHEQAAAPVEGPTVTAEISVCIGPEGGFSTAEIHLAEEHGWRVASIGDRRLRSETAAIAAAVHILA